MFVIAVSRPGFRSAHATFEQPELVVGRSRACEVRLPDDHVSKAHCRLMAINGGALLVDLGSRNGTAVNGALVRAPTFVTAEDQVRVGPYFLTIRSLTTAGGRLRLEDFGREQEREVQRPAPARDVEEIAQSPWELLGVSPSATRREIRAAYLRLLRQYHPDKVAALGPELRAVAERKTRELNAAWELMNAPRC